MKTLQAVVIELGTFAYESLFGARAASQKKLALSWSHEEDRAVLVEAADDGKEGSTFTSVAEVLKKRATATETAPVANLQSTPASLTVGMERPVANSRVVVASPDTPLYLRPTREFDAVLKIVHPGEIFVVATFLGQWVEVVYESSTAWLRMDAVVSNEAAVHPYFVIGAYCGPEDTATTQVRACIRDMFAAGRAELPLRAEEYVAYRLQQAKLSLPGVSTRPRVAGSWKDIFKGIGGVHIGITPKKGAVMEYVLPDGRGALAYVDAVFPNQSITVSEIGVPEDGYYHERTIAKEVWQELGPVFIQFS